MEFRTFDVDGPVEIIPRKIQDERGYFSEIFRASDFMKRVGDVDFVQENQSLSARAGTIRGIHFQIAPFVQAKLVRCTAGKMLDVAVDLRRGSPTFGRWVGTTLTADENNLLWIPAGFGHAFCTLEPNSVITYRVSNYYSAEHDKGVAWNDPQIGIRWPELADPGTLSAKDVAQPKLADLPPYFTVEKNKCGSL
ncbi:dTDP-4-dehydrorhamnose 3,5-epimerase [Sphingomonas sp. BN140010]|uniref:dTDP-4-dehydrorhamnose 3,5-epimerase n=1 Tax=Sphingomonas arvum TaxID=2992113 RepID=A0ABT3JCB3_9SPHN|nr:dTDP-4-dehydrorhamnose 3,5-epimerase [Sphingomonas sp. BN140010]MCW3796679.1 dTDP-4-dehydrorhamnose 3,5-epimerase [Sphingomonas sp. BN140010]